MGLRNVKLTVSYDGRGYHGWQRQQAPIVTVQQVLEEAIAQAVGHEVSVRGSGRTDTGVHAAGQVANFLVDTPIPTWRLARVINKYLPADVRALVAEDVDETFDAITSARSKLYRYTVYNQAEIPIALRPYCYQYFHPCQVDAMREAGGPLAGEHDFASFTTVGQENKSTVRTIYRCQVWRKFDFIYFDLEGGGFLYHMVRNIVGTLLEVGRGRREPGSVASILAARDRTAAGPMAPAQGLSLQWVRY